MRIFFLAGAIVLGLFTVPAVADEATDRARVVLLDAMRRAQDGDHATAEAALKALVATPAFAQLDERSRHSAYFFLVSAALELKHYDIALEAARKACAFPAATDLDWALRVSAAWGVENYDETALSLTTIAQRWPLMLANFPSASIIQLVHAARKIPDRGERKLALMQALFTAGWRPKEPFRTADGIWFELAEALVNRRRNDEATRVIARISRPLPMIRLLADKRFDAIIGADRAQLDVQRALDQELEDLRAAARAMPDKLEAIYHLAFALIARNRAAEALAILDDAIARARQTGQPAAFSDMGEMNWIYDVQARALYVLGRHDEAIAQMRVAATLPEDGEPNVSSAVNLAAILVGVGRSREAVDMLAGVKNLWPYAEMQYRSVLVCAHVQLGENAAAEAHLRYLREHEAESTEAVLRGELCAGDENAVAAHYIRWLNDPATRSDTLLALQNYLQNENPGPFYKTTIARDMAVRARADVRAAIARVGRVSSYARHEP